MLIFLRSFYLRFCIKFWTYFCVSWAHFVILVDIKIFMSSCQVSIYWIKVNSHTILVLLTAIYYQPWYPLKAWSLAIYFIQVLIINFNYQITHSMTFNNSYERVKEAIVFQEAILKAESWYPYKESPCRGLYKILENPVGEAGCSGMQSVCWARWDVEQYIDNGWGGWWMNDGCNSNGPVTWWVLDWSEELGVLCILVTWHTGTR